MIVAGVGLPLFASASELVYRPIDPGFGGSPLNTEYVLGTASAVSEYDGHAHRVKSFSQLTVQQRFIQTLQSRLLSSVADEVDQAIFGKDAKDHGTFRFGTEVVSFNHGLETIDIQISDESTGESTSISVPTVSLEQ